MDDAGEGCCCEGASDGNDITLTNTSSHADPIPTLLDYNTCGGNSVVISAKITHRQKEMRGEKKE